MALERSISQILNVYIGHFNEEDFYSFRAWYSRNKEHSIMCFDRFRDGWIVSVPDKLPDMSSFGSVFQEILKRTMESHCWYLMISTTGHVFDDLPYVEV